MKHLITILAVASAFIAGAQAQTYQLGSNLLSASRTNAPGTSNNVSAVKHTLRAGGNGVGVEIVVTGSQAVASNGIATVFLAGSLDGTNFANQGWIPITAPTSSNNVTRWVTNLSAAQVSNFRALLPTNFGNTAVATNVLSIIRFSESRVQ